MQRLGRGLRILENDPEFQIAPRERKVRTQGGGAGSGGVADGDCCGQQVDVASVELEFGIFARTYRTRDFDLLFATHGIDVVHDADNEWISGSFTVPCPGIVEGS